jgi:CheY-like chemotaxis protein
MFNNNEDNEEEITAASLFDTDNKNNVKDCIKEHKCENCKIGTNNDTPLDVAISCKWALKLDDYNDSKPSILLVDDNPGIISFLLDDIESLDGTMINIKDYNILTFDTINAAYNFEATQHKYHGLNIKYAILDLTLGGSIPTNDGPSKYTGVDIYQQIMIYNPEVKVLFYTGNNLNDYIRSNKKLIEQFNTITNGKDIKDYVLFKTSLDLNGRREYFGKWFNQ